MTLSSSKTLAFVPLPRVPVNKFPRAVRANRPKSPESGRDQAVPRLPSSLGAPARRFPHLPGCHGQGLSWACTGARIDSNPDPHGSTSLASAARPLRPLRAGRSPPPGPGPARPGLCAPPPGLITAFGPGWGREGSGRAAAVSAPTSVLAAPPPEAASAQKLHFSPRSRRRGIWGCEGGE